MKCNNCPAIYISQTDREIEVRYKEHLPKIKATSNKKLNFAQHLVLNNHNYTNCEKNWKLNDQLKFESNQI